MSFIVKIWIAYVLDLIFGDPYWFPHPVRIIGKYISILEKIFYKLKCKKFFGGVYNYNNCYIIFFSKDFSVFRDILFIYNSSN